MALNETDNDRLVHAGDLRGLLDDPHVMVALDDLTVEKLALESVELPTRRRDVQLTRKQKGRRHTKAVLAGLVVLAVGVPLSAAATGITRGSPIVGVNADLHTGIWTSDDGHPAAEVLNLKAPEAVVLLRSFESKYPLPPGGTYAALEKRWPTLPVELGHSVVVEQAVEYESYCQWIAAWLDAHHSGDTAAAESAVHELRARPDLPIVRTWDAGGLGGNILRRLADEAAAGVPDTARQYFAVNCAARPVVGN